MKKIIVFIITLTLVFCIIGCSDEQNSSSDTSTQIVVLPNEEIANSVNGYKNDSIESSHTDNENSSVVSSKEGNISSQPESSYYVGNKNSKKFHTQYCKYVSSISDKNLHSFETADQALEQGYSPCGYCMKE